MVLLVSCNYQNFVVKDEFYVSSYYLVGRLVSWYWFEGYLAEVRSFRIRVEPNDEEIERELGDFNEILRVN